MSSVALKDCCEITLSSVDKKSKDNEKKVKLCNFTDVYYNWNIYKSMVPGFMNATASDKSIAALSLKKGDVLITKDSETRDDIGMSAYVADDLENVVLGYHCALIRPNEEIDGAWLNGILSTKYGRKYFDHQASGSGQRYTLAKEPIGLIKVPSVELREQKKIGQLLNHIDVKMHLNNEINSTLKSMIKALYDYWFYQFEFPSEEGKPYKSSGGRMTWNEKLKREIPDGWDVNLIGDCIQHINTGLNPRDNFVLNDGDIKYITVKNITNDSTLDFSECDTISKDTKRLINKRSMIDKGDILFASIAPLGRCYLIQDMPIDWEINESVFSIRPNYKKVCSEYLFQFFTSAYFVKKAEHSSTGSIFNGIRISTLQSMPLLVPPKNVMDEYKRRVSNAFSQINILNKENECLSSLRDFLLPMLMNGQAHISD